MVIQNEDLSRDDLKLIATHHVYPKLIKEIQLRLSKCRDAVDTVSPEKLLELQGRIHTYKETIGLLTEVYKKEKS